ncbi:ferredoxin family protein [Candidatus Bathyarchaeota archaeon]|nr:ferredoxin family protein [Candidatus Bathyarchaeota archaeon]
MSIVKKLKKKTEKTAKKTADAGKTVGEKGLEVGKEVGEKGVEAGKKVVDAGKGAAEKLKNEVKKKRKVADQHQGHDVWVPLETPEKHRIHGTNVAVDWEVCTGDAVCVQVCPVNVFEMVSVPGYHVSDQKSDPIREKDCIQCMSCETQCPVQAIKVST